jgi:hypothetical protein
LNPSRGTEPLCAFHAQIIALTGKSTKGAL